MILVVFNEEGELERVYSDRFDDEVKVITETADNVDESATVARYSLKQVM